MKYADFLSERVLATLKTSELLMALADPQGAALTLAEFDDWPELQARIHAGDTTVASDMIEAFDAEIDRRIPPRSVKP